jgi:hypothetical protein
LKALSLRPHKTCPNCLECTKVRDHSEKLIPNNCPSILKSTSFIILKGSIKQGLSTRVPQNSGEFSSC